MRNTEDRKAPARGRDQGHGRRLTEAFRALEAFPALAESRDRLLKVVRSEAASPGDMVAAVESDVALSIAVLRIANAAAGAKRGKVTSVCKAVDVLRPQGLETLATRTAVFDFFERAPGWDAAPERFRIHAIATQRAADRLARETGYEDRGELLVSALLHDVGKLVLELASGPRVGDQIIPAVAIEVAGPQALRRRRVHFFPRSFVYANRQSLRTEIGGEIVEAVAIKICRGDADRHRIVQFPPNADLVVTRKKPPPVKGGDQLIPDAAVEIARGDQCRAAVVDLGPMIVIEILPKTLRPKVDDKVVSPVEEPLRRRTD